MTDATLFDQPTTAAARITDPLTSHLAAATIESLSANRYAVWQALNMYGARGATDEQIAVLYEQQLERHGWPQQSPSGLRTRRKELFDRRLVADTGLRERMTTGRWANKWRTVNG